MRGWCARRWPTSSADRRRPASTSSPTASRARRASSATSWSASPASSASRPRQGRTAVPAPPAASTWTSPTTTRGPIASRRGLGGRGNTRQFGVDVCTGPVSYRGQAAVQADIENLRAAGRPAPRGVSSGDRAVLHLRHAAQPFLPDGRGIRGGAGRRAPRGVPGDRGRGLRAADRRSAPGDLLHDASRRQRGGVPPWAARRVEAINHALRDIPPERVRFHTCYSIDVGPRVHDMALKDIVDVLFRSRRAHSRSRPPTPATSTSTTSSSSSSRRPGWC